MKNGDTSSFSYFSITSRIGSIPELDGLRGIAILLVLFRHVAHPIYVEQNDFLTFGQWDLAVPLLNGWMGVDLFFVLSGFLITHHLMNRWPSRFNRAFMLRYWFKRILRTFPAYYVSVIIAMTGLVPLFSAPFDDIRQTLGVHLLFLQDYLGSDLVPAFWSLGVEEKFYLLCPLVLLWIRRLGSTQRLVALAFLAFLPLLFRAATIAFQDGEYLNYTDFFWSVRSPFHLAMDGLWIGVICALIYRDDRARKFLSMTVARRIFSVSAVVLVLSIFGKSWFEQESTYQSALILNLISFAFGGLLLSVIVQPVVISPLLRVTWLRGLSTISYSVYLLHLMFVPLSLAITDMIVADFPVTQTQRFLLHTPIFLALSLVAGCALHFAVEKPFLLLKDRIRL